MNRAGSDGRARGTAVPSGARATVLAGALAGVLALAGGAGPAAANDSEAEIGIGGVTLRPSAALVLDSEDLYISEARVRVRYRFTNPTDQPITVTVAFPLPTQPRGLGERGYVPGDREDWASLDFRTVIDGKPATLTRVDRAMIGQTDVTERLAKLGFPLWWFESDAGMALFEAMPAATRERYVAEGLAVKDARYEDRIVPAWDVATFFTRRQTFAPRASVAVEHSYAPVAGGSVGGILQRELRRDYPEEVARYRRDYCIDDSFLAGIDRRMDAATQGGRGAYATETWLGYVLSSGANWKGPIGDFRLVVDKGTPDRLVSFCMDGVRKLDATRFEVRRRNFEPTKDLAILIVRANRLEE